MARFLVTSEHIPEDCTAALDSVLGISHELLNRFDWGCKAGKHVGYCVVEAQDEATARMLISGGLSGRAGFLDWGCWRSSPWGSSFRWR